MVHKGSSTGPRIVFAVYKPRSAADDAPLRALITQHGPTLRRLELVTDRAPTVVKSSNGAYVEVFEWQSDEAAERAHDHPEVAKIWEAMGKYADNPPLASLPETQAPFTHYEPVQL